MNAHIAESVSELNDDEKMTRATALFFEADQLEAFAYGILDLGITADEVMRSFSEAKSSAAAKRAEAHSVLESGAGKTDTQLEHFPEEA